MVGDGRWSKLEVNEDPQTRADSPKGTLKRSTVGFLAFWMACGGSAAPPPERPLPLPTPAVATVVVATPSPELTECLAPFTTEQESMKGFLPKSPRDAGSALQPQDDTERRYAGARRAFEAHDWATAARDFRAVALGAPEHELGIYAAQLYLECINQLASAGRSKCYEDMGRDVGLLREAYCKGRRQKNEDACNIFDRIALDVRRLEAQRMFERGEQANDAALLRSAGEKYAVTATECIASKQSRCDEIAFNAAVAFLAAGDADAARLMRDLIRDSKSLAQSPLLPKLQCRIDNNCPP